MTMGIPASLAARIMGTTVVASLGATRMPSTPRAMNVWICSNWRLASLSATASIISMPRRSSSARTASKLATQYSVCSVSKATPMRTAGPSRLHPAHNASNPTSAPSHRRT